METAPKDVLFTIAMNSELPALLRWCESSSRIYKNVCGNDAVWRAKLLKDYPDYDENNFKLGLSPKETYVFMYQLSYIKKLLDTNDSLYDIFRKSILNFSNKKLMKIPSFNLPNLQNLILNNNQLTEIPQFNLPNLEYLSLNGNKLKEVPNFNLPKLQYLYLSNNQLTEVPNFNLPKLRSLEIYMNQLTEIPQFELPNLTYLNLYNNQLTEIPPLNLPKLMNLFLHINPLTEKSKKELKKRYGNKVTL